MKILSNDFRRHTNGTLRGNRPVETSNGHAAAPPRFTVNGAGLQLKAEPHRTETVSSRVLGFTSIAQASCTAARPAVAPPDGAEEKSRRLVETLAASELFRNYSRAFGNAVKLPLSLQPVETFQLPHHRDRHQSRLGAVLARHSKACAAWLTFQQELRAAARDGARTMTCPFGLSETAIPVRAGGQIIGFLVTGQVFCRPPKPGDFSRVETLLHSLGIEEDSEEIRAAFFATPVIARREYDGIMTLLETFAQQLGALSNQLVLQQQNTTPPCVERVMALVRERHTEDLSLADAATAAHASLWHICKLFKKATGLGFTEYVSRFRVERAKEYLLNPNFRVSEIAYEVGFQSLTHFNRIFRRITGESPTGYRAHLPKAA
ncbi:MAG: helix-turn-helix domain-containing protein [Verrucomicrobia bacterium]|nr:helix-turn-helix domain-containing protein [Verrucomicrobiota bacterium]